MISIIKFHLATLEGIKENGTELNQICKYDNLIYIIYGCKEFLEMWPDRNFI